MAKDEPSPLDLLRARYHRALELAEEARRQTADARARQRIAERMVDECRIALDLSQDPTRGM